MVKHVAYVAAIKLFKPSVPGDLRLFRDFASFFYTLWEVNMLHPEFVWFCVFWRSADNRIEDKLDRLHILGISWGYRAYLGHSFGISRQNCHIGQWDWSCSSEKGLGSTAWGGSFKEEESTGSLSAPGTEHCAPWLWPYVKPDYVILCHSIWWSCLIRLELL